MDSSSLDTADNFTALPLTQRPIMLVPMLEESPDEKIEWTPQNIIK